MTVLVYLLASLLLLYLGWGVLYQLCFAVVGKGWQLPQWRKTDEYQRIVVLIPAYREDSVIINTAKQALEHNYPSEKYEVVVIADSFSAETLVDLRSLPIRLEEVSFSQSTKSKSLNACFDRLGPGAYDIAVILDADNLMQPDFLQRINAAFGQGVRVLQGRRAAKNSDTTMAILDGLSEEVNNHILCAGPARCGLSARLAGSGMAFSYDLLRDTMQQVDAIGGFDKELELRLTRRGERVHYDPLAIVLDEKVRKGDHFSRQRSRWIAAQFHYARRFFWPALHAWLWRGKFDHFNKASQMLLPPRLLTPGVLAIGGGLLLLTGFTSLAAFWWLVLMLNLLTFALSMPGYAWRPPYRDALLRVPLAFWYAVWSMVGIQRANRQFIHTPHGEEGH